MKHVYDMQGGRPFEIDPGRVFRLVSDQHLTSEEGANLLMLPRLWREIERQHRSLNLFLIVNAVAWFLLAVVKP